MSSMLSERRKVFEKPLLDGSSDSIIIRFPGLYDMPAQAAPQPGGPYKIRLPPAYDPRPPAGYPMLPASDDPYTPSALRPKYVQSDQLEKAA